MIVPSKMNNAMDIRDIETHSQCTHCHDYSLLLTLEAFQDAALVDLVMEIRLACQFPAICFAWLTVEA